MAKDNSTSNKPEISGPVTVTPAALPSTPVATQTGSTLKTFLVSLPRHKSLMTDPNDPDKKILVDKLPIEAETEGDAIQKFNKLNGIIATQHKHVVEPAVAA